MPRNDAFSEVGTKTQKTHFSEIRTKHQKSVIASEAKQSKDLKFKNNQKNKLTELTAHSKPPLKGGYGGAY